MSKTAIIKTGEKFFIKQLSESQPIKLDKVIFANINGITGDTEIDLNGSMPAPDQIVHAAPITQAGLLNDKTVVYSVILDTNVGDFSFNYIGLVNTESNTLCMVMHTDLTKKIKTAGQRQGNTITESIWLEIDNASESTGITVNAETWQIDYSKRLAGEDERIRLTNYDLYNRLAIHSGFGITKNGNQLTVSAGITYVAGLRVDHTAQTSIKVENNQSLYIDAWLAGTTTGEWSVNYNLITGANLRDYHDGNFQHYVERIALVDAAGNLIVVNPKSFVTTCDHASTEKWGIIKLNSATNSVSETEAATPKAVKSAYDLASNAVKKSGDEMSGQLQFNASAAGIKFKYETGAQIVLRTGSRSFGFMFNDAESDRWMPKLRYNYDTNIWNFENINNVTINGKPALKAGDYGIGGQTGATVNNFDGRLVGGFYQCRTSNFPNLPLNGRDDSATLLAYPSCSEHWKVEQLAVVNSKTPRIYYRTDSKDDGKQNWYEAITTANMNNYLPVGIPQPWPQVTPPAGWFECNGSIFDKNQYPKLAKAYPSGYLPDLRGEFIRGWDNGRGVDHGRNILYWQDQQVSAHRHVGGSGENFLRSEQWRRERMAPFGSTSDQGVWGGVFNSDMDNPLFYTNDGTNGGITIQSTTTRWDDLNPPGLVGHETRPRNVAFMYIVKAE